MLHHSKEIKMPTKEADNHFIKVLFHGLDTYNNKENLVVFVYETSKT